MTKDIIRLRCGKSILPSQEVQIDMLLSDLIEKGHAKLALLIDTSGQVISFNGDRGSIDLVSMGALVAADFAASQEIARLANLYQENQMIIRQGSKINTIIHEVGRDMVLMVMISSTIPLGWFCYLARQTTKQISHLVLSNNNSEMVTLSTDNDLIAEQFSSALDSIWKD
jgi:predicted regulator of Ras-like GTPase activity (Roadblock/LC7/MglB family)